MATMTFRESILRTFEKKAAGPLVWQPRIYYWYYGRQEKGNMPEKYREWSMLDIYDDLGASPRYPPEVIGISPFNISIDNTVRTNRFEQNGRIHVLHETPVGTLREIMEKGTEGSGSYHIEYMVKNAADMKVMKYILEHTEFSFNREAFETAERVFGDRGVTQTFYPRAPLQRLIISYMGFENTVYALTDAKQATEDFMKAIEDWDDHMYSIILDSPLQVLNFGENIDSNIDSPKLYNEYLLPYYKKRVEQLHSRGKYCHIHMDGSLKPLLPYLQDAGFDGIEAATPLPQGDVTIEELKEAMGDTILLDGIPAILFVPHLCDEEELLRFTEKLVDTFFPNLILGVSDELPPPSDIERIRLISQFVKEH